MQKDVRLSIAVRNVSKQGHPGLLWVSFGLIRAVRLAPRHIAAEDAHPMDPYYRLCRQPVEIPCCHVFDWEREKKALTVSTCSYVSAIPMICHIF